MRKIVAVIIILTIISTLIFLVVSDQKNKLAPDPPGQVTATGSIEVTEIDITPRISGLILDMSKQLGEKADSGDLLVIIDAKEMTVRLNEIESGFMLIDAQIKQADIQLKNIKTNLARMKKAFDVGAATRSQYDDLASQRDFTLQQIKTLETQKLNLTAQNETLLTQISNAELYSPRSGWISSRNMQTGEMAMPGIPIYTLSLLDKAHINVYVNETRIAEVNLGDSTHVIIDNYPDKRFLGFVNFISPEAEFTPKNIQTKEERVKLVFEVRISLDNIEHKLKPGLPADVIIFTE
jgi:multidrug resistance efflux pump